MTNPTTGVDERLWAVLQPYLEAEGVELDDLDVRGRGNGRIVRVTVDTEAGVGVDRIAELSRGLSRVLDEEDPIGDGYTLEVSSPGLERPLRRPSHFAKAVGREVDIKTADEIEGAHRHRGTLEEVAGDVLLIEVDGTSRRIPIGAVTRAQTIFRWEKAPKPGAKRGKR